jgi:hypothetical protein
MEFTNVELLPRFKHRYKFKANLYNIQLYQNYFDKDGNYVFVQDTAA